MKSLLSAARKALDESNFETAIEKCNVIIDQDPKNYHAHLFKGFAFSKMEQVDSAIDEFESAVAINPDSPLAYQGLISITQNDPMKLIKYYCRLAQIHATEQPQKYFDDLMKMIKVYETLNDYGSIIDIWEKMLPRSIEYHSLKEYITYTEVEIWGFILNAAIEKDKLDLDKEWNIQKFRIQSKSMDLVKIDIEKEINKGSKVGEAIENILIKIDKGEQYYKLCDQLICFLYKRLQFTEIMEIKSKILDRILQLCHVFQSISDHQILFLEPFRLEMELSDYSVTDYDLPLIQRLSNIFKDCEFGIICSILYSIRTDGQNITSLIDDFSLSIENNDFVTLQALALASSRAGINDQALELAQRAQLALQKLSIITGKVYPKRSEELDYFVASSLATLDGSHLAESLSIYRKLLERDPNSRRALLGTCEIMIKLKNWEEAASHADKCLSMNEKDAGALIARGWVAFHQNDLNLALHLVKLANELNQDARSLFKLGRIYWEMGGDYRSSKNYALSFFLRSAKEDSTYAPSFCYLGLYYELVENDSSRAMKCFQKSIQLDPYLPEANEALITLKLKMDRNLEAIELLESFCEHTPRNSWAHKVLGELYIDSSKYADAIFHLNQSLRFDSKNPVIWTSLGQALSHEGKYFAALKAFRRALDVANQENQKISILYLLSSAQLKLAEIHDSVSGLHKILESLPHHFPTRIKLVEAYICLAHDSKKIGSFGGYKANLESALRFCVDGLKFTPNSVWSFRYAGRILTLFLMDGIICDTDLLVNCFNSMKSHLTDSDGKTFNELLNIGKDSSFQLLMKCSLTSLIIACREAREFPDLQTFCVYDLSLCHYFGYVRAKEKIFLRNAIKMIRVCIEALPDNYMFWNSAGVFLQSFDVSRSQHCLVKSTYLSKKESAWINLTLLAIKRGDFELSQELVNHALIQYPDNLKLWLSKTMIARQMHHIDFKSILEHTFQLSEGELYDVSFLQLEGDLSSNNLKSLENSVYYAQKPVEFLSHDSAYLNILALGYERLGSYKRSLDLLKKCLILESVESHEASLALISNVARLMCVNSDYTSALNFYESKIEKEALSDPFNLIYLSICYYKLGRYEDSLKTMDSAIESSCDSATEVELLITLGRIVFNLNEIDGHIEIAKEQFLKGINHDASKEDALLGLLAISVVLDDEMMAESVLAQLGKYQSYSTDISYWTAAYHELRGDVKLSKRHYLASCHHFPSSIESWNHLIRFSLNVDPDLSGKALTCSKPIFKKALSIDTENMYLEGLYLICIGSLQKARTVLLKALHLKPHSPRIWAAMYLCCKNESMKAHILDHLKVLDSMGEGHAVLLHDFLHFDNDSSIREKAKSFIARLNDSSEKDANLKLSIIYYNAGDYDNSLKFVKKCLDSAPSIDGFEILAAVYSKRKHWTECESAHKLALDSATLTKERIVIHYRLLKHFMETGDHRSASESLTKIYELEGENSKQKLIQAVLQKRNGNSSKSKKILESIEEEYMKWFELIT